MLKLREKNEVAIIQFGGQTVDLDVLHVLKDVVVLTPRPSGTKQEKLTGFLTESLSRVAFLWRLSESRSNCSPHSIMDSVTKLAAEGKPVLGICNVSGSHRSETS